MPPELVAVRSEVGGAGAEQQTPQPPGSVGQRTLSP